MVIDNTHVLDDGTEDLNMLANMFSKQSCSGAVLDHVSVPQ